MSSLTSQFCLYQQDVLFSFKSQGGVDLLCLWSFMSLQRKRNLCFQDCTVLFKRLS